MFTFLNTAIAAQINTTLPGPYSSTSTLGPVAIVGNIYLFALGIGGLLAFGSIVFAGIEWATSRGNPSAISDAQDQITQAFLGLLLLTGSYIILNTINPQLTVLQIPKLAPVKEATLGTGGGSGTEAWCSPDKRGRCAQNGKTCEQQPDGKWACVAVGETVWTCKNNNGLFIKACWPISPGTNQVVCSTWCASHDGQSSCYSEFKPNSGCQVGVN